MNKELKPCPFCGGEAKLMHEGGGLFRKSYVECTECYASSYRVWVSSEYSSDDKAIELWNKRNTSKTTIECEIDICEHNDDGLCKSETIHLNEDHCCDGGCDFGWKIDSEDDEKYD